MFNTPSRRRFLKMTVGLVAGTTIAALPSAASRLKPNEIARKRLLLVDNNPKFQLFVKDYLQLQGYEVITAFTGREVLEVLEQDIPDLIVSDAGMRKMEGYAFVKYIRQDKRTRGIPFMFLSDQRQTQDIVKGLNLGADRFMVKPFEPEELVARVEALIRQSHRLPSTPSSKTSSVRKRLLLVEYYPDLNLLIKDYLEFRGYEVIPAFDGREALGILDLALPDLIVSCITMPVMDGYTFVENIRQNKRTRSTPFLFISTRNKTQDRIKGLNLGADEYMAKPFEPEELVAQVEALISTGQIPRRSAA